MRCFPNHQTTKPSRAHINCSKMEQPTNYFQNGNN